MVSCGKPLGQTGFIRISTAREDWRERDWHSRSDAYCGWTVRDCFKDYDYDDSGVVCWLCKECATINGVIW